MNNDEFLKSQCNRYVNGYCSTRKCLVRGGWKVGMNQDVATCESHEILVELESLRDENKCLSSDLNRVLKEGGL